MYSFCEPIHLSCFVCCQIHTLVEFFSCWISISCLVIDHCICLPKYWYTCIPCVLASYGSLVTRSYEIKFSFLEILKVGVVSLVQCSLLCSCYVHLRSCQYLCFPMTSSVALGFHRIACQTCVVFAFVCVCVFASHL